MRLEGNANTWDRWTHMVPCDAVAFRYSVMELESASSKADDSRHDSKRDTSAWRRQKAHFGPKFSFFRPSQTKSTPRRLYCTIRVFGLTRVWGECFESSRQTNYALHPLLELQQLESSPERLQS